MESMAVPLPGETALIVAALIAATTDSLNIWIVIAVAAFGAIVGDIMGPAEVGIGIAAGIIVITAVFSYVVTKQICKRERSGHYRVP